LGSLLLLCSTAWAIVIPDVQMAALDQPQINIMLQLNAIDPNDVPLSAPYTDFLTNDSGRTISIQAYFDTGASGILLSHETYTTLQTASGLSGVSPSTTTAASNSTQLMMPAMAALVGSLQGTPPAAGSVPVLYSDVGVGGVQTFNVSNQVYLSMAPFNPDMNGLLGPVPNGPLEQKSTYTQTIGPVRMQLSQSDNPTSPMLALDVVGTPAMAGKVVVMDPKPVENLFAFMADPTNLDTNFDFSMHTSVFNSPAPGTTNPNIPTTNHHVKLSYGNFQQFTTVTPGGATGPDMAGNPFIGPDPVAKLSTDHTPGITVTRKINLNQTDSATGSFLFDTGAAASMISSVMAGKLGVHVTQTDNGPVLVDDNSTPLDGQFQLTVSGIGGDTKVAGFHLSSLLLPTTEGATNPNENLTFTDVPVLVSDISLLNPETNESLTLDGVFGMNMLVASTEVIEGADLPFGAMSSGAFNWIVFDQTHGILGLDVRAELVPEPGAIALLTIGAAMLLCWRRLGRKALS
jgi:hypothetical protein